MVPLSPVAACSTLTSAFPPEIAGHAIGSIPRSGSGRDRQMFEPGEATLGAAAAAASVALPWRLVVVGGRLGRLAVGWRAEGRAQRRPARPAAQRLDPGQAE